MKKKISFIILIITILLLVLGCNNSVKAAYGDYKISLGTSCFGNSNVYCIHQGQSFSGGGNYYLDYKYEITKENLIITKYTYNTNVPPDSSPIDTDITTYKNDSDAYKYFQGIAYIAYAGRVNSRSATNVTPDKYQRAMWNYLKLKEGSYGIPYQGTYSYRRSWIRIYI